jgi:hypothetical protein
MRFTIHPSFFLRHGNFNAVIAPDDYLVSALERGLAIRKDATRYICRARPRYFRPGPHDAFAEAVAVESAEDLLAAIRKASCTRIIVEHHPSFWEKDPGAIGPFIETCRRAVERRASLVVLIATQMDEHLTGIVEQVDRLAFVRRMPAERRGLRLLMMKNASRGQRTLEVG